MPAETESNTERQRRDGSVVSIVLWWQKFHFSGRVIMCSVLFGLGIVLVGGIVFAINANDDSSSMSDQDTRPDVPPPKPPSNVVGPVMMGIGSFIVTVGVIMCLFETQVCRKKNSDSNPLISENPSDLENNQTIPKEAKSKSHKHGHGHHSHKHGARKDPSSPKRSKHHHAKSHSKEQKAKTLPVSIDTSKGFMTSSEEKFLTPPSTIEPTSEVRNSREEESQTSTSLMKSFTSSGPSWTQSNEFQTPSTSFRDSSISLKNSMEVKETKKLESAVSPELLVSSQFMTPITLEEEKIQKMANEIENRKKTEVNTSSEQEQKVHLTKKEEPNVKTFSESEIELGNKNLEQQKKINAETYSKKEENNDDRGSMYENQSLDTSVLINVEESGKEQNIISLDRQDLLETQNSKNILDKNSEVIQETTSNNEILNEISKVDDSESSIILQEDQKEKLKPDNDTSQVVLSLAETEQPSLHPDEKKEALLRDTNQDDTPHELESSASSDETVVSKSSVLEKPINLSKSEKNELEGKLNLANQDEKLDAAELNSNTAPNSDPESQAVASNVTNENKVEITDFKPMQNDLNVDESSSNMNITEITEGTISCKSDFIDNHNIQPDISNENTAEISNLKTSEENTTDKMTAEHENNASS